MGDLPHKMKPLPSIIADPAIEALVILGEECAEVIKEISKIQRFGIDHVGPTSGSGVPARAFLAHEVGQLYAMIEIAQRAGLIPAGAFTNGVRDKREKLAVWSNLPADWIGGTHDILLTGKTP